jgi:flagellar biosynthesis protein FlhA
LQLLLEESVHIRDIRTIIESIAEHAGSITDPVELARRVRVALSPAIVQQIYGPTRELNVIAIDPNLERLLVQALGSANGAALDPGVADMLTRSAAETALRQEEMGVPACLLVPDQIRGSVARLVRRVAPRLQVLAHSEIPETHTIRIGPILRGAA